MKPPPPYLSQNGYGREVEDVVQHIEPKNWIRLMPRGCGSAQRYQEPNAQFPEKSNRRARHDTGRSTNRHGATQPRHIWPAGRHVR